MKLRGLVPGSPLVRIGWAGAVKVEVGVLEDGRWASGQTGLVVQGHHPGGILWESGCQQRDPIIEKACARAEHGFALSAQ